MHDNPDVPSPFHLFLKNPKRRTTFGREHSPNIRPPNPLWLHHHPQRAPRARRAVVPSSGSSTCSTLSLSAGLRGRPPTSRLDGSGIVSLLFLLRGKRRRRGERTYDTIAFGGNTEYSRIEEFRGTAEGERKVVRTARREAERGAGRGRVAKAVVVRRRGRRRVEGGLTIAWVECKMEGRIFSALSSFLFVTIIKKAEYKKP